MNNPETEYGGKTVQVMDFAQFQSSKWWARGLTQRHVPAFGVAARQVRVWKKCCGILARDLSCGTERSEVASARGREEKRRGERRGERGERRRGGEEERRERRRRRSTHDLRQNVERMCTTSLPCLMVCVCECECVCVLDMCLCMFVSFNPHPHQHQHPHIAHPNLHLTHRTHTNQTGYVLFNCPPPEN